MPTVSDPRAGQPVLKPANVRERGECPKVVILAVPYGAMDHALTSGAPASRNLVKEAKARLTAGDDAQTAVSFFVSGGVVMAWILLFVAGLLEIVWAYTMKLSEGFTRPGATTITLIAMIASFGLLSMAMKTLPLGTAYTVWTGIGAVGAFVLGIAALGEPTHVTRVLAAALIVAGIVLMRLSS